MREVRGESREEKRAGKTRKCLFNDLITRQGKGEGQREGKGKEGRKEG